VSEYCQQFAVGQMLLQIPGYKHQVVVLPLMLFAHPTPASGFCGAGFPEALFEGLTIRTSGTSI
jgi:hypothetical protein